MGSCGDDVRNIVGCPLAGVDADEIYDASPLVTEANRQFVGNPEFYNLPRKFKICITGCNVWCSYPEINDVGLTALGGMTMRPASRCAWPEDFPPSRISPGG